MQMNEPIRISEAKYAQLAENYGGFCLDCSNEAFGVPRCKRLPLRSLRRSCRVRP